MSEVHPLTLELSSLKSALEKYQHAAHVSSLQLQRANLNASDAFAHSRLLETENQRLKQELLFLRATPEPAQAPRQVTELSLALRRLSDKLSFTESILVQKTTELAQTISEKARMELEVKAAFSEADRIRRLEDEHQSRERELQRRYKAAEEEARMADLVIVEYADLVRSLEDRLPYLAPEGVGSKPQEVYPKPLDLEQNAVQSALSSDKVKLEPMPQARSKVLIHSLTENRFSLQRLLNEFNSETTSLQTEISRLHAELFTVQSKLDAEREISNQDRVRLAEVLVAMDRIKADDETAGKLVSRYMRFSQSSIDMLQTALSTLKSRHAATMTTMSSSSEALSQALALERTRTMQLREILDQLTEDISRETFGRRREVSLRLQGVAREERIVQALSAWLRRAEENRKRAARSITETTKTSIGDALKSSPGLEDTLNSMVKEARAILMSISDEDHLTCEPSNAASWARVALAEHICKSLLSELRKETEMRLALTKTNAEELFTSLPNPLHQNKLDQVGKADNTPMSHPDIKCSLPETVGMPPPGPGQDPVLHATPLPDLMTSAQDPRHVTDTLPSEVMSSETGGNNSTPSSRSVTPVKVVSTQGRSDTLLSPIDRETGLQPHPPLDKLTRVPHRYEQLQRAFRDCHLALAQLKMNNTPTASPHSSITSMHNVIRRLDDFCEDARVELEIRVADDERLAQSFETMLRVPGALTPDKEEKARRELQSFVDGTAPSIVKVYESYTTKLTDLQHDIAQVKRALHKLEGATQDQIQPPKTPPAWSSWTTPFLSTSPARSPDPAPTFGTVITTPRSRRVSSTSPFTSSPTRYSNKSISTSGDPYAHLELRISMPSQVAVDSSPLQPSRLRNTKLSSGIYLLGLAASNSDFLLEHEPIPEAEGDRQNEHDLHSQNHGDIE